LRDRPELKTKTLFERCLGEIFPIMGFDGDLLALGDKGTGGKYPRGECSHREAVPQFPPST
jgi:hypothetical protein